MRTIGHFLLFRFWVDWALTGEPCSCFLLIYHSFLAFYHTLIRVYKIVVEIKIANPRYHTLS